MNASYKQNRVSQTVWPWQKKETIHTTSRPPLVYSLLSLIIAFVIAGLFYYFKHLYMAVFIVCTAAFIFCSAQFFPKIYKVIENLFQKLSKGAKIFITYLLLVPFYYVCFGIGSGLQKILGKDPMQRGFLKQETSYWKIRDEQNEIKQYKRQF